MNEQPTTVVVEMVSPLTEGGGGGRGRGSYDLWENRGNW